MAKKRQPSITFLVIYLSLLQQGKILQGELVIRRKKRIAFFCSHREVWRFPIVFRLFNGKLQYRTFNSDWKNETYGNALFLLSGEEMEKKEKVATMTWHIGMLHVTDEW
jgi:hypothetical protein